MAVAPYPATRQDGIVFYLNMMQEISGRAGFIGSYRNSEQHPGIAREICYLQLRQICELLAMALLALRADEALFRKLAKTYEPRSIFAELRRQNEYFYPECVGDVSQGETLTISTQTASTLNPDRLNRIWGVSGAYLHRLSLKKLLHDETDGWFEIVENHLTSITEFLRNHWVFLNGDRASGLLVTLQSENGRPAATVFGPPEQGQPNAISYAYIGRGWELIGQPFERLWRCRCN